MFDNISSPLSVAAAVGLHVVLCCEEQVQRNAGNIGIAMT